MNSSLEYCRVQIAQYDRDRYLVSLFADSSKRPALWALYAFNLEIATISERVKEPILGMIRLTWWRDNLKRMEEGEEVPNHELLQSLGPYLQSGSISYAPLYEMIEARERDLYADAFADENALFLYLKNTAGNISRLAFDLLGDKENPDIAEDLGVLWGLTGFIRSLPLWEAQNRVWLPPDLTKEKLWEEAVSRLDKVKARSYRGPARSQMLFAELAALDLMRIKNEGIGSAIKRRPFDIWRLAFAHYLRIKVRI